MILIIGGAGYVGSVLVQRLIASGSRVRVLDTLRKGGAGLVPCCGTGNFEFIRGDLLDQEALDQALVDVDVVVNLASIVGTPACDREPRLAEVTNVEGMRALVASVRDDQLVVFASTGSVYGRLDSLCTEESKPRPLTLYGRTKLDAEEVLRAHRNHVIYRFATAFGVSPRMRFDLLPNTLARSAAVDSSIVVYEPEARRTFIHVSDMARSFEFAVRERSRVSGQTYNVGSMSLNLTKRMLAEVVRRETGCEVHYGIRGSDPDGRDYAVSYKRLNDVGFRCEVSIEEGLRGLTQVSVLLAND